MNRIKLSALNKRNGTYYFEDQVFTGTAFSLQQNNYVIAEQIVNGIVISNYYPQHLQNESLTAIDATDIWEENEGNLDIPLSYFGKPYTGLAYGFSGSTCDTEVEYLNGERIMEAVWGEQGLVLLVIKASKNVQRYEWHENGTLATASIRHSSSAEASFGFSENGDIHHLRLENGFTSYLLAHAEDIAYCPINDKSDCYKKLSSKNITLTGNEIDDEFLAELVKHNSLKESEKISFRKTALSISGLYVLQNINNLQQVNFSDTPNGLLLGNHLRQILPNIKIIVDNITL